MPPCFAGWGTARAGRARDLTSYLPYLPTFLPSYLPYLPYLPISQAELEIRRWRPPPAEESHLPRSPAERGGLEGLASGGQLRMGGSIPTSASADFVKPSSVPPPRTAGGRFNASGLLVCFYHTPSPTCTYAHMHTCTHAHMHICRCASTTPRHLHMHICTYAHMHTCTYAGVLLPHPVAIRGARRGRGASHVC